MTAVSFDISMSLDEYIAAPNRRPEEPSEATVNASRVGMPKGGHAPQTRPQSRTFNAGN
jgi:hypothetical protein